jgi:WbqC-like protein family
MSGKSIAILQSNYIPWKGYFDLMAAVDEFVIFDDVQFTKRDWRNRNRIVSNGRVCWLTIPVRTAGRSRAPIDSIEIADAAWAKRHWARIEASYRQSEYFHWLRPDLERLYRQAADMSLLTDVNELFLRGLANLIELPPRLARSNEVPRRAPTPTERLIEICQAKNASVYVTGPAARSYIDTPRECGN